MPLSVSQTDQDFLHTLVMLAMLRQVRNCPHYYYYCTAIISTWQMPFLTRQMH